MPHVLHVNAHLKVSANNIKHVKRKAKVNTTYVV